MDDPTVLKAMIATLQSENAKISATLRVHDQLVQALRLRIAKLQKLAFGKSSEKVEREIPSRDIATQYPVPLPGRVIQGMIPRGGQWNSLSWHWKTCLLLSLKGAMIIIDEGQDAPKPDEVSAPTLRRCPRVSDATPRERHELDPGTCCPDCGGDLRVTPEACSSMRTFGATGEDVSELLDIIAAQMKVVQIARIKKSCRRCERMVQEPAPSRPIPGSMAGPNLLAHVPPLGDASIACRSTGLEVRRSSSLVSPTRDLRPHGASPLCLNQWRINDDHSRDHAGRLGEGSVPKGSNCPGDSLTG